MGNWNPGVTKERKRRFIHFKDLILFENDRIIVVNKPAGISSLEDRKEGAISLQRLANRYHEGTSLCHRLDKGTSGALVIAKDPEAYKEISLQFEHREVLKHYVAVVIGARDFKEFVIDAPLAITRSGVAHVNNSNGKEAVTVVDTVEKFRGYSLVECQPMTGRTHQIRVHLAAVNCPILGDETYGGPDLMLSQLKKGYKPNRRDEERPVNHGMLLHARGIAFRVPGTEEVQSFVAPLPDNFEVTLKVLRKYGSKK